MAPSTQTSSATTFRKNTQPRMRMASSILNTLPKIIGTCTPSPVTPGHSSWTCARGANAGKPPPTNKRAMPMNKSVEFFFDLGSPTTYLAYTQLPTLCAQAGSALLYRPMLLGGVFKATGNASPVTVPAKGPYLFQDLSRFAKRYGVEFKLNPHFPINTLLLMRAVTGMQLHQPDRFQSFIDCLFRALWVNAR